MSGDVVLCINSGSSSLKFSLFAIEETEPRAILNGAVERIGEHEGRAWIRGSGATERLGSIRDHARALDIAFSLMQEVGAPSPTLVGHRVVHGGSAHVEPTRVDASLLESLKALVPLAPLHMPASVAAMETLALRSPELPQVACFDTSFHSSMPELARRLPLPKELDRDGVRRYGFHGLSYEFVMSTLGKPPPPRVIIAHLGNGSSLVAVRDGRSIDTTMSFTPSGGILMGTRAGDIDPGILVYLLREKGFSVDSIERLVDGDSGLVGVGGVSDMAELLDRAPVSPRADLAVRMFGYAVRKAIGGLVAALGGVDVLVFAGGIGEHAARVRADACEGLELFGIRLDRERNERGDSIVSDARSPSVIRVIATDEDFVIARHTFRVTR